MALDPIQYSSADAATSETGPHYAMEGNLLKLADRGFRWNNRYFTFLDNQLAYYHQKGDEYPKNSFLISKNGPCECEIGALYIDERQQGTKKQVLYCLKITWNLQSGASDVDSLLDDCTIGEFSIQMPTSLGVDTPCHNHRVSGTNCVHIDDDSEERRAPKRKPNSRKISWKSSPASPCETICDVDDEDKSKQRSISAPTNGSLKVPVLNLESHEQDQQPILAPRTIPDDEKRRKTPARNSYLEDQRLSEKQLMVSLYKATKKESQRKIRRRVVGGSKLAAATGAAITVGILTAGVGLLAGLVFLGASAAAGGTGVAAGAGYKRSRRRRGEITLASEDYEEVRKWKSALDACLASESVRDSTWGQLFVMGGRSATTALLPTEIHMSRGHVGTLSPKDESRSFKLSEDKKGDPNSDWLPIEDGWTTLLGIGTQGLRIFREEREQGGFTKLDIQGHPCAPLKTHLVLSAAPLHAFMCLMSLSRIPLSSPPPFFPASGQRASFRVLKMIDDNMDVIHLIFRPLYLFPSWTAPRDFVLFRYWRYETDGTYVVCYESVGHQDCPPIPGYTRAEMHGVYTIAPLKKVRRVRGKQPDNYQPECLITSMVQVDPKGWIPHQMIPTYGEAFAISALMQLLDIRDALDHDRFLSVSLDSQPARQPAFSRDFSDVPSGTPLQALDISGSGGDTTDDDMNDDAFNYDFSFAHKESRTKVGCNNREFSNNPPPLSPEKCAEPDANSFRVRGKSYKKDKLKINAGSSIGKLIAVDVVAVDAPVFSGFSVHPTERMQLALERETRMKAKGLNSDLPPFVFIVNISLPGPPYYHGVFYYAVDDMSSIDGKDGTASSKLCKEFFFGDSDEFRHKTFKLIPQIVEGNFLVRKAVGSTPAIMGSKLRQLYVRSERFLEVILDCGSSSVATGVIRLSLGYAKTLVVDMGFLIEGSDETTLPERIVGAVRIKNLIFGPHLRKVDHPSEANKHETES